MSGIDQINGNIIDVETVAREIAGMVRHIERDSKDNRTYLEVLAESSVRIAVALEVIASDITERKEREPSMLAAQRAVLAREVSAAEEWLQQGDAQLATIPEAVQVAFERLTFSEAMAQALASASLRLSMFDAAHPGIAETAGDV